ncbi:MAG: DUF5686 and carboxypeptidase regulatory-like domain-containing protein [Bacteroidales bacterium]|nr:DUF5686 and carboxypeptidase regulatory-like domain-containing protein [Bacteroidales bacterium]
MEFFTKKIFFFLFILIISSLPFHLSAQVTKIMGKVINAETQEPIPFANVFFKGTTIGVITDFEGKYSLETNKASDTLIASFIGYETNFKKIAKNRFQEINFKLLPRNISLPEVVILPGENPAEILLRKIIENKKKNNRKEFDAYQYEVYNKIEIDANNISEKFKNRKILKPFKFIFNYIDTSTINGKTYLPIFLSESISDIYFRKNPKTEKEIIKATKMSGIENESVSQFLGDMFQNYCIYDNYLTLFQKNFVSPIANFGLSYYRYYLVDSTYFDDKWCYQIMFKPKRKQELTFTGNFWVNDSSFAIKSFDIRIVDDANINFINDLVLEKEFDYIDNKYWMVIKDKMVGDFNIIEETKTTLGFFGRKTTTYKNFVFNSLMDKQFYSTPTNIFVTDSANNRKEEYWDINRHCELSKDELTIYYMIDTLKSLPAFQTWIDIVEMLTTGYYVTGNYELGPYMSLISYNEFEGIRLRFGGRTSNDFSTKIMFNAHIAYGTRDEKIKYGIGFLYMLNKNPRRALGGSYIYDIEQLGESQNAFREDFLLAAIFRRNPSDKLSMVGKYKVYYEHEWYNGLSNTINFIHRDIAGVGGADFIIKNEKDNSEIKKSIITTSEIRLDTRIAYREKFIMGEFERFSLGAKYPILEIQYGYGIPDFLGGEYEYHKLQLNIRHWFNVLSFGWSKYIIEVGRIWGIIPYPLLKLHEGNETYLFDECAFNMMNYYEFASNKYLSFYYTHHFQGLLLNKIPLMRKLKWREVFLIKGVIGDLDEKNKKYSVFPETLYTLRKPYFETGAGIENIFKIFRIDLLWRLSYLDHPDIAKFGIRFSFRFDF